MIVRMAVSRDTRFPGPLWVRVATIVGFAAYIFLLAKIFPGGDRSSRG